MRTREVDPVFTSTRRSLGRVAVICAAALGLLCFAAPTSAGTSAVGPTTVASVSPAQPDGQNGWYLQAVQVTLIATGAAADVASTQYEVDLGPWTSYTGPFTIADDGAHTVQFSSTDIAGNVGPTGTITVKVDQTAPTATGYLSPAPPVENGGWYLTNPTVTLTGNDGQGSGVARIDYSLAGSSMQQYSSPLAGPFSDGLHVLSFRPTDNAGNTVPYPYFSIAFKTDSHAPEADLRAPADGVVFEIGDHVVADFSCIDPPFTIDDDTWAPPKSCIGTQADGAVIDTSLPGSRTFTVTAEDDAGNVTTVTHSYTVVDAPILHLPADITVEGSKLGGAVVSYAATATDPLAGILVRVVCSPKSGTKFPVGTTSVKCSAISSTAETSTGHFNVTVTDTTAPVLHLPANKTLEATGPDGRLFSFVPTAKDIVDGAVTPICDSATTRTFPLGLTTVTCSATDSHGNTASASFTILVRDTTKPVLTLPPNLIVPASSATGAVVTFVVVANDLVDGPLPMTCTRASASQFPVGVTTVKCSATDSAGNTANGKFTVTVTR